jgi:hypothetical protein
MAGLGIEHAPNYPENLSQDNYWNYDLTDFKNRLDNQSGELFCDETFAEVEVLQLQSGEHGKVVAFEIMRFILTSTEFSRKVVRTHSELLGLLSEQAVTTGFPQCQHV